MKRKYIFRFRPLAGPPWAKLFKGEHSTMEAGPFTCEEAIDFAHDEVERRTLNTGVAWVCDYSPIDADDAPTTAWGFVMIFLILVLVSVIGYLIK